MNKIDEIANITGMSFVMWKWLQSNIITWDGT